MSAPIYFFPKTRMSELVDVGAGLPRRAALEARGCWPAFAGLRAGELSYQEIVGAGPDGSSGTILVALPRAARKAVNAQASSASLPVRLGYVPEYQTWTERPAGADCWCGIDKEYPPTPEELQKGDLLRGHVVRLGDGGDWEVPVVRSVMRRATLPEDFIYDASGKLARVRQPQYDELWRRTQPAWDHFFGRTAEVDLEEMVSLALDTLALNYRIGKVEQTVLKLVNSSNWDDVIGAALDWPLFQQYLEAEKKTSSTEAVPTSSNDSPDSPPNATTPAAPNCGST